MRESHFNPVEWGIFLGNRGWSRGANAAAIKEALWECYGVPVTLSQADEVSACLPYEEEEEE